MACAHAPLPDRNEEMFPTLIIPFRGMLEKATTLIIPKVPRFQ